jgi:hypothetical protein
MIAVSRFARSSLLGLLATTLTAAAYAHSGSNGSMGSRQPSARIVAGRGANTLPKGPAYWCGPHHHNCVNPPVVHIPTAPQGAAQ